MKEAISEMLHEKLSYIYCHNCSSNTLDEDDDGYNCDYCCRKSMGWELSKFTADELAELILKEIK